jgi:hypothetical protein
MIVLYCNDQLKKGCGWSGDPAELVTKTEDLKDLDFSYCPNCDGKDFYEEEEPDE